jgi:hypothetical protein
MALAKINLKIWLKPMTITYLYPLAKANGNERVAFLAGRIGDVLERG